MKELAEALQHCPQNNIVNLYTYACPWNHFRQRKPSEVERYKHTHIQVLSKVLDSVLLTSAVTSVKALIYFQKAITMLVRLD